PDSPVVQHNISNLRLSFKRPLQHRYSSDFQARPVSACGIMSSHILGRVQFGEKTLENRKIALEKSPSVARFNDVCAECSYCGVVVYFTAGGSYAIEYLMDHLKAVHGGLSIGFRGEVSAPGVATAHALTGNTPLVASNDFVRKYGNTFLEGAGRRSAAAAHLLDFAAQASDSLFPSVSHIDML
ncbi:hypothetical protein EV715DRAFT_215542, partial [Schizophyllum commune]